MQAKKAEISQELYQYALKLGVREHPVLARLRADTAKLTNSIMQIPADQGQLMGLLAKIINAKRYLELGVFTGYSSLVMALAMGEGSEVTGLDNNPDYIQTARTYWASAGVESRIRIIEGDALESCRKLVEAGKHSSFDIAFIDANKADYPAYYEYCHLLVRVGGLILIDNVLFQGEVLKDNPKGRIKAIKELNELIHKDPRVEISLLAVADGLTICYKKDI